MFEFEKANAELLRAYRVLSVRGALELLMRVHVGGASAAELTAYFSRGVGEEVLRCCNASDKVLRDSRGRQHTAASLAAALLAIKARLNSDAHDGRSGEEYARDGDAIVLRRNGFSESDVTILSCLLTQLKYPVRFV